MTSNDTMLKVAGLWLRRSANGNQYLAGRLGGLKILITANRDKVAGEDPTHVLFLTAPTKRPAATERPNRAPTARKIRNAYQHQRPVRTGSANESDAVPFDDPLPDDLT
jgi:hypothetical protein